jgi:hypothetical protein
MRHANPNITMALYTHPVSSKKREAQTKVVEMIRPAGNGASCCNGGGYGLMCTVCVPRLFSK